MKGRLVRGLNTAGRLLGADRLDWFDVERMVRSAKRKADVDAFEDASTLEGMSRLFDAYEREGRLTLAGKVALSRDALTMLTNRLTIEKTRSLNPDIARERIDRPIVVLGLPRSGTTLLHHLLAQDPRHRCPLGWEIMYPVNPESADAREALIARAARRMAGIEWLSPGIQRIHEMNARLPQECIAITGHTFESFLFETMCRIPSYQRWLDARDLTGSYEFHRRFLQHLQYREPRESGASGQQSGSPRTWALKAPTHLHAIPALLSVYPDARIVQTHREPTAVLPSLASLIVTLRAAFGARPDPAEVGLEMLDRWSKAVERAAEWRDALSDGTHVWQDFSYRALMADPILTIARLYDGFGQSLSGEAADGMRRFLADSPKGKFGVHRYSLEDFALDEEHVREQFDLYYRRFGDYL